MKWCRYILLFIICFVAACRQYVAAGAGFVSGQCSGFTNGAAHMYEDFHPFTASGTSYFCKSGCPLPFLTSVYKHRITSPNEWDQSVFYFLLVSSVAGKFLDQKFFLVFQSDHYDHRIKSKCDQGIP